jgi:type I thyroxine 5'-deiodinase
LPVNVREKVLFADPKNEDERSQVASSCVRDLKIELPALIDDARNSTERAYTGWPDRLYLIDQQSVVRFKSKPGPFGFHVKDLAQAVRSLVPAKSAAR